MFDGATLVARPAGAQDLWLTKAHDARRTGQSGSLGIRSVDQARSWQYTAEAAAQINIGASVTDDGVFFGSWGLLRSDSLGRDARFWNKSDGKLYALDPLTGVELWEPARLDTVHRCYELPGRPRDGNDLLWCGLFNNYHVSFYNGTVEGQATIDTSRSVLYLGRGDGRLYAIDPQTGETNWRFVTFNPEFPDDPDGGGEIVASPLLAPDGSVYIGTWGEGNYETHAVYGVRPDGTMKWRYPSSDSSLSNRVFASPALAPDGETLYVATYIGEPTSIPATLYAFDLTAADGASDEQRLKWSLSLEYDGNPVYSTTMAVGSDGTIYVGGFYTAPGANRPLLGAFRDNGASGAAVWTDGSGGGGGGLSTTALDGWIRYDDNAQFLHGIALREPSGVTQRLYVSTANVGTAVFNAKEEGTLFAVDPGDGTTLFSYDPSADIPDAVGGLNSPAISADGIVYFGVRGRFGNDARNGHYFAVTDDGASFAYLWSYEADGHVEWAHPAIGPDGSIYAGSGIQDETLRTATYEEGEVPEGSSPTFFGLLGPTSTAAEPDAAQVAHWSLGSAYPNPARDRVTISLTTREPALVLDVSVFDILGRLRLAAQHRGAGPVALDTGGLPSGVYQVVARDADYPALTTRPTRTVLSIVIVNSR